jgi:hypothetical protein
VHGDEAGAVPEVAEDPVERLVAELGFGAADHDDIRVVHPVVRPPDLPLPHRC